MIKNKNCTIIPIKSLAEGKKRLETFLSPNERKNLILSLLKDVLTAATSSKLTDKALLITPDSEIVKITKQWNLPKLEYIIEPVAKGINHAVQRALKWCISQNISSILIIPADIPLVKSNDIDELIHLGQTKDSIIVVPSHRKDGTNAFYQKLPHVVNVWYGEDSFQKNLESISNQDISYLVLEKDVFALDIDLKEDLEKIQQINDSSETSLFVKTLNL
ncbi:MAG: 2-phospho-L-lactate guanylyltransferase [Candidatus Helarchaeota archaeon]|nr:2-phospho-L-lactate guanylyltransferase [Candidatus Helarchaeota archaeon]